MPFLTFTKKKKKSIGMSGNREKDKKKTMLAELEADNAKASSIATILVVGSGDVLSLAAFISLQSLAPVPWRSTTMGRFLRSQTRPGKQPGRSHMLRTVRTVARLGAPGSLHVVARVGRTRFHRPSLRSATSTNPTRTQTGPSFHNSFAEGIRGVGTILNIGGGI